MTTHVIEVNDATFEAEVLRSPTPVLVDFGARWCGPCKLLLPVLEGLATEQSGQLKVVKVDIDDSPRVARRYAIRSAPTLMVFRGGERTAQHVGVTNRTRLLALVAQGSPGAEAR
ncbi:MAG: thioredoxin [Myxococcales bacterium]|nr:MAG: thioredoxin [Myxococcales bacterium]